MVKKTFILIFVAFIFQNIFAVHWDEINTVVGTGNKEKIESLLKRYTEEADILDLVLIAAIRLKKLETVKFLIKEKKANPNAKNRIGQTALITAIQDESNKIAKFLLQQSGIDINAQDNGDMTVLMHAISELNREMIQILLGYDDIKLDTQDMSGDTALHVAVNEEDLDTVQLLLNKNINIIDIQNDRGETALFVAVESDLKNIIEYLLEKGANVDISNKSGRKPIDIVKTNEIVKLLELSKTSPKSVKKKKAEKQEGIIQQLRVPRLRNLAKDINQLLNIAKTKKVKTFIFHGERSEDKLFTKVMNEYIELHKLQNNFEYLARDNFSELNLPLLDMLSQVANNSPKYLSDLELMRAFFDKKIVQEKKILEEFSMKDLTLGTVMRISTSFKKIDPSDIKEGIKLDTLFGALHAVVESLEKNLLMGKKNIAKARLYFEQEPYKEKEPIALPKSDKLPEKKKAKDKKQARNGKSQSIKSELETQLNQLTQALEKLSTLLSV